MTLLALTLLIVSAVLQQTCCYENLSRKNSSVLTQSSTFSNNVASLANDGNLRTTYLYCAHTAPDKPVAWFQVDFGSSYNVHSVKIYYRKDDSWKQYRFRQFYLDVSDLPANQTTTRQRTRCYTDNTTAPNLLSNIIDIPCKHTARYVIVETTYDAPEDQLPGAFLEICEIEVYGCENTHYGPDCSHECSVNCIQKTCNLTGSCKQGCKTGFHGDSCNNVCSSCPEGCNIYTGECEGACHVGKFGTHCDKTCSNNCKSGCDKSTGVCITCVVGMFGESCNQTCSSGCVSSCDRHSGNCVCKPAQQSSEATRDYKQILYGIVAVLCLSVVLNISLITWILRKGVYRRQNSRQSQVNETALPRPPVVYDSVEDNTDYQELGQISGPTLYGQIKKN